MHLLHPNLNTAIELVVRDQVATLAAVLLSELEQEALPISDLLMQRPQAVYKAQWDMLVYLMHSNYISLEQFECSYVEPGCVEHNVVHVHVNDKDGAVCWLTISPITGVIDRL